MRSVRRDLASRSWLAVMCLSLSGAPDALAATVPQCRDDAMLVFDASRSMINISSDGADRPRIDEARAALRQVLPQVTPFRDMGLIVYGPGRQDVCGHIDLRLAPLPDAGGRIMAELDGIAPDGDTPLTEAVAQAAEILRERVSSGAIVLITDGRETCGGQPCRLAERLSRDAPGLTVHIIGFQTQISSFEWQSFGHDDIRNTQVIARCLADRTGGTYATAQSTDDLIAALQDVLACPVIGRAGQVTPPPPPRS